MVKRKTTREANKVIYFLFTDRDECMEENDCDDMARCENTYEGYKCSCAARGFKGTGIECTGMMTNYQLLFSLLIY